MGKYACCNMEAITTSYDMMQKQFFIDDVILWNCSQINFRQLIFFGSRLF